MQVHTRPRVTFTVATKQKQAKGLLTGEQLDDPRHTHL